MEFNPNNPVVRLCIQGMNEEDQGHQDKATLIFQQAWEQAANKRLGQANIRIHQAVARKAGS